MMRRFRYGSSLVLVPILLAGLQACALVPRPVVSHDPLTADEHVLLGQSYEAQGLRERATYEYEAALRQDNSSIAALIARGNVSFESSKLQEAEEYFSQALALAPQHAGAKNNLAMVYLSRGERLDDAERLARQALDRGGTLRPYVLDTLATLYVRQGRYEEAQAALAEAEAAASSDQILNERLSQLRRELPPASSPTP
ncbi:MAG: tetratricopeptide repeat protein [Nitrospiraceae bacterium]